MSDILVDTSGDVLTITFNRPAALNALNLAMLTTAAEALRTTDARVVVISGQGRAFSSGADLRGLEAARVQAAGNRLVSDIVAAPRPVVAKLNGPAVGIGMSIALAADLCVAAESVYFLQAFINIGLMPDGGATELVAASIGRARAEKMALLGERMPAAEAAQLGLIGQVVADDELDGAVQALVEGLAAGPTLAYAGTKAAINANSLPGLRETLDRELEHQQYLIGTADGQEGVGAFLEKRPPQFTGT